MFCPLGAPDTIPLFPLKEFVSKASLRYILRTLAGLAVDHAPTQLLISEQCIPILHQTEQASSMLCHSLNLSLVDIKTTLKNTNIKQVSSDEHVGSLAEAVLEAMAGCDKAEEKASQICSPNLVNFMSC